MLEIELPPMTHGSIFPKIVRFSLPLAATGILQLLFNAADVIVVGKFSGSRSLAAVGSTSALINLLVGAFIGLSIGANILVARYIGCRQDEHVRRSVHCSIALSAILGVAVLGLGLWLSVPLLRLMDNFFLALDDRPPEAKDWESPYCVNVKQLVQCIEELHDGKEAQIPWYDFVNGRTGGYNPMQGSKDAVIIAEGIHMKNVPFRKTIWSG